MKKFISFALAASMALSMVPATAFAASDLTASHSNIRVTANTEFYPKKVADADASLTTREVPYILLEATTDFKYDEQTFELALENAEWLERKDDGDILFVETDEYMKGDDGVKFKPEGSTTTEPGTSEPTTPGTQTPQQAETAYKKAVTDLLAAREAYNKATAGNADYVAAKKAYDEAKAAADAAADKVDEEKEKAAAAKKELEDAKGAEAAYEAAKKVRESDTYQNHLKNLLIDGKTLDNVTSEDEALGVKYYSTADAANYFTAAPTAGDTTYGEVLSVSALYLQDADGDAATAEAFHFIQLSDKGLTDVSKQTSTWLTAGANTTVTNRVLTEGALTVVAAGVTLTAANVATGIQGSYIELSAEGNKKDRANALKRQYVQDALDYLPTTETGIADAKKAILSEAELGALQQISDEADANIQIAQIKADQAAKKAEEAKKALDALGATDLDQATANLDKLIAARKTAGVDYLIAVRNAGGEAITTSVGAPIADITGFDNSIDTALLVTTNADYVAPDTWLSLYKDAVKAKGLVAGAYDIAVGEETLKVEITKKSDSRIIVKTSGYRFKDGDVLSIPLFVRTTGGTASVSIDSLDSEFTSQGKTFAKTADGDTELSIEKVQNFYDDDEIKNLYLEELVAGTIEPGKIISLRINGDFKMKADKDGVKVTRITGDGGTDVEVLKKDSDNNYVAFAPGDEADEIYLRVKGTAKSTKATQYRIQGLKIVEDGADFGDEASITVSGGGTSKQTIKIGNYEDFGVKLTAEDKDLPVIYAGTMANSKYDNQTLKVTIEETVANSFIDNRKMEITLPEGVEFVNDSGKKGAAPDSIDDVTEDFKVYNFAGSESDVKKAMTLNDNGTKITISGKDLPDASGTNKDRKRKIEFSVHVSAEADFTGDVVMTLGGPGVADKNVSATVATVKAPIEVRTAVNELKIDYRNTEIADITLVEPEAGLWAKDDVINLEGERMSFESGAKAEVVNGDMKLDKYDGDYLDVNDGVLSVKVSSRSSKTPAEIKISGLSLYMDRSLAAGNYKLKVFGEPKNEFFMNNYDKDGDDFANVFETQKVTVMDDFVKIVTAGRDKDDATFTTKIVVPVGGDVITAGTKEIKLSEMQGGACPPAYINNDGYTMLPVRAVVEALNEIATVRWDDATKTCTIGFGQRVFSMTVGSKVLNLNGVSTALNAAPENKDGRVFLPLRDLGYALGLSDSQISWDSTTQTAQLN